VTQPTSLKCGHGCDKLSQMFKEYRKKIAMKLKKKRWKILIVKGWKLFTERCESLKRSARRLKLQTTNVAGNVTLTKAPK
jgi:hypothetical protein